MTNDVIVKIFTESPVPPYVIKIYGDFVSITK